MEMNDREHSSSTEIQHPVNKDEKTTQEGTATSLVKGAGKLAIYKRNNELVPYVVLRK